MMIFKQRKNRLYLGRPLRIGIKSYQLLPPAEPIAMSLSEVNPPVALAPKPSEGYDEKKYLDLIYGLTDPAPCYFDHHGSCQGHYLQEDCPHGIAQRLLKEKGYTT